MYTAGQHVKIHFVGSCNREQQKAITASKLPDPTGPLTFTSSYSGYKHRTIDCLKDSSTREFKKKGLYAKFTPEFVVYCCMLWLSTLHTSSSPIQPVLSCRFLYRHGSLE